MSSLNTFNSKRNNFQQDKGPVLNNAIRAPKVLCINGETGENLGVLQTYAALKIAADLGLDLIQVAPGSRDRPPTCKLVDYGKLKYIESKKKKEEEKHQRQTRVEVREIQFRPSTSLNDLKTKARKAQEFLDEGDQVRLTIVFKKKREASHKNIAYDTLDLFMTLLPSAEFISDVMSEGTSSLSIMINKKVTEPKKTMNDNNG